MWLDVCHICHTGTHDRKLDQTWIDIYNIYNKHCVTIRSNSWNKIADWLICINKLLFYLRDFNSLDIFDNADIDICFHFKKWNIMWIDYFVYKII